MKILAIVGAIDLKYRIGCAAQWWSLFKNLHELGHDVVVMSYLGRTVESPWWKAYPNPVQAESMACNWFIEKTGVRNVGGPLSNTMVDNFIKPHWKKAIHKAIAAEEGVDAVAFMTLPMIHFRGVPEEIRRKWHIPVLFYDGDLPSTLPEHSTKSFRFNNYGNGHKCGIEEYDTIISCSSGCLDRIKELGAKKVACLYYGADPSISAPGVGSGQGDGPDVFFYGNTLAGKESRVRYMIEKPSESLPMLKFMVAGKNLEAGLGRAEIRGAMSLSEWRYWCTRSKVNVNVTKEIDASIPGSSSARIFELASMGCCIVTDEYSGIERWFEPGKEIVVAKNAEEAVQTYLELVMDKSKRETLAKAAKKRLLAEHTYKHRAKEFVEIIKSAV